MSPIQINQQGEPELVPEPPSNLPAICCCMFIVAVVVAIIMIIVGAQNG